MSRIARVEQNKDAMIRARNLCLNIAMVRCLLSMSVTDGKSRVLYYYCHTKFMERGKGALSNYLDVKSNLILVFLPRSKIGSQIK